MISRALHSSKVERWTPNKPMNRVVPVVTNMRQTFSVHRVTRLARL